LPQQERAESLGSCLELIYNMMPSNSRSEEANMILKVLGVGKDNMNNLENDMNQLNI
jgi:hypothetical protein